MLMEYMAKGRPVIASYNTGHMDILDEAGSNAILLRNQGVRELIPHSNMNIKALWWEPSLDELVAQIEWAYNNRDELNTYGFVAAKTMKHFTWERTADTVLAHMENPTIDEPDYLAHRHVIGDLFNRLGYSGEGAEIGVFSGSLSRYIHSRWPGKKLHLIDRWKQTEGYDDVCNQSQDIQDGLYDLVKDIFKDNGDVNIIREESLEAAKQFSDGQLDWVYIDADHSYDAVKADIETWSKKVRLGGLVSGDDYFDGKYDFGTFGVKSAVDEYVAKNGYKLKLSADAGNLARSWYFIKEH
jgi:hypothetical protein